MTSLNAAAAVIVPIWAFICFAIASIVSGCRELSITSCPTFAQCFPSVPPTIPQQWQNGLPIIGALLTEQNYAESLVVIEETLQALLKSNRGDTSWTPEASLLVATSGLYCEGEQENANTLLCYYQ